MEAKNLSDQNPVTPETEHNQEEKPQAAEKPAKEMKEENIPQESGKVAKQILKKEKIELCVLAVPFDVAHEVTKEIVDAGIKGILNFTSAHLKVPSNVYIERYDMISKLEKLAYFTNKDNCGGDEK